MNSLNIPYQPEQDLSTLVISDGTINATGDSPMYWKDHRDRFVSTLGHEVRNPLTNINLAVELMQSITKEDDLQLYIDIIIRNSERISGLITKLLHYQPVDERPRERYSARRLLSEVLQMAEDRISLRGISVKKIFIAEDRKLLIDAQKMKMALTNIVINAIDAMTSEKRELTLETQFISGVYSISIEDTGCGISKEGLTSIFKPYYTNKPGGLGLGLSTTYEILMSDHVQVSVDSELGLGTRFTLLFDDLA
jgi:signal transduction histidine kinase